MIVFEIIIGIYMHSDRFTCMYCCKVNLLQELDHVELILHLAMRHIQLALHDHINLLL